MPKYRLLTAHYTEEDKWLPGDKENEHIGEEAGTIVGDETTHKWTRPPTPDMVGLDEKSQRLVDEVKAKSATLDPTDYLPLTYAQGDTSQDLAVLDALRRALTRGSVDA